jgi:hypothetical protein
LHNRYYGYYSNVSRGKRRKQDQDGLLPSMLQPQEPSKGYRKTWARLIQKIYEIDPLTCPKCHGPMAIIAFIEAENVVEKILKHLGVCEVNPPYFRRVKPRPVCVRRTGRPPPRIAKSQSLHTEPHIKSVERRAWSEERSIAILVLSFRHSALCS